MEGSLMTTLEDENRLAATSEVIPFLRCKSRWSKQLEQLKYIHFSWAYYPLNFILRIPLARERSEIIETRITPQYK